MPRVKKPEAPKHERDALDRFYTEDKLALAIAREVHVMAPGARSFCEPSSGGGAFLRAMKTVWDLQTPEWCSRRGGGLLPMLDDGKFAWNIQAIDIDPGAEWAAADAGAEFVCGDYLQAPSRGPYDVILSNPPFAAPPKPGMKIGEPIAAKHCEHMLEQLAVDGVCAVLLRASFLGTQERAPLFKRYVPVLVQIIEERPSFTGGGTDRFEYCVIYWQRQTRLRFAEPGSTKLRWLSWKK